MVQAALRLAWLTGLSIVVMPASITAAQQSDTVFVSTESWARLASLGQGVVDSIARVEVVRVVPDIAPPKVLKFGRIEYPETLRQERIEGRVMLRFVIGRDGRAEEGTITMMSTDAWEFVMPAITALREARFEPARINGRPVRVLANLPVDFKIRPGGRRRF